MEPKITIIIPVYNVEQYLRQCLDSVVKQTLQDIQVLCVDHSSTDRSLAILEEFASKDTRIEIIHCENTGGGPGQARNAGLPHVKSKYLYFADSDDWLDPTLCEKAYYRLEQSNDDVVLFYAHEVYEQGQEARKAQGYNTSFWRIQGEASDYLAYITAPWNRVVRTSYLEKAHFRFPEGRFSEDIFFHWFSLIHQSRVSFLPHELYYYRQRAGSEIGLRGEVASNIAIAYSKVKKHLLDIGEYERYREEFLIRKLSHSAGMFGFVLPSYKAKMKKNILATLDDDEITFIKERKDFWGRDFYLDLLDMKPECPIERKVMRSLKNLLKKSNRVLFRPLENLMRHIQGKPKRGTLFIATVSDHSGNTVVSLPVETPADRQIRELSELVCQLSKEVVELREQTCNEPVKNRAA